MNRGSPRLWYSPYKLQPLAALNRKTSSAPREGFLIRIQTEDFEAGYADCHPWKMFGDESPKELLQRLRQGRFTPLLERSLFFAQLDGLAREQQASIFDEKIKIKSHYTWTAPLSSFSSQQIEKIRGQKFSTIKIKATGKDEMSLDLWKKFKWRIDFNGQGGEKFLQSVSPALLKRVDLIEDPEPYNLKKWNRLSKEYSVEIAYDQPPKGSGTYSGTRVIKPARQGTLARAGDIITNSMDHPVGQGFAFWQAQESVRKLGQPLRECGLKTAHLFKSTDFFDEIYSEGPFFKPSSGTGVGFDDLLARLKWLPL
jgi:O-succinylbenzoate synthase